jgi:hypothetical protein
MLRLQSEGDLIMEHYFWLTVGGLLAVLLVLILAVAYDSRFTNKRR